MTTLLAPGPLHNRALQNQTNRKVLAFLLEYTGLGTELNSEYVRVTQPNIIRARLIPELLRIRFDGTANFSVPVKFVKTTMVDGTKQNGRQYDVTWTRTTTTCTVTVPVSHAWATNQHLNVTNSSDTAAVPNGPTGIITRTGDTTFTFLCPNAGAASGTATIGEVISAQRAYTYTRSTTTVTVTSQGNHGLSSNDILNITAGFDVLSMPTPGALGLTGVITVASTTTFTFACTDAGAASGSITLGPAAGNYVPLTSSVAFTQAAIYTGAVIPAAVTTITPIGFATLPMWRKEDELRLIWGVITTVPPTTRVFQIEGQFYDLT